MATPNEALARSITRSANGHAYATIQLLGDRRRVGDAFRAYAYFRWLDDRLDLGDLDGPQARAFLARQRALIGAAYRGETTAGGGPAGGVPQGRRMVGWGPLRRGGAGPPPRRGGAGAPPALLGGRRDGGLALLHRRRA